MPSSHRYGRFVCGNAAWNGHSHRADRIDADHARWGRNKARRRVAAASRKANRPR